MPTFFKITCSAFWIIWMVTISFLCAVLQTQDKYSYIETKSELTLLMIIACTCTITMAVVGCCCIKLEVQQTCCAIWYIVPTLLCNLLLGTAMIVFVRSAGAEEIHEEGDVLRLIRKEMETKSTIPKFMYHTQLHYGCCGVYGFKDYRAFFLPTKINQDIPYGCCHDPTIGETMKCPSGDKNEDPRSTVYNIYLNTSIPGLTLPYDIPSDQEDYKLEPTVARLYGTEKDGKAPDRYKSPLLDLPVNITRIENFNLEGCFQHLEANSRLIHNYYLAFSMFLITSSFVMCILFGKSCVSARRSQHTTVRKLIAETMAGAHRPRTSSLETQKLQGKNEQRRNSLQHKSEKAEDGMVGDVDGE